MTPRKAYVLAGAAGALTALLIGATLVVSALDVRVLDPDFYVRHLERAGAFSRLSSDVVPKVAAAKAIEAFPSARPAVVTEIAIWARRLLSPAWLERATRTGIGVALGYLTRDRSELTFVVSVTDRVREIASVLEERLDESPLATAAYERLLEYATAQIENQQLSFPYGITTAAGAWEDAIRLAMPEDFLAGTSSDAVRSLAGWLLGDTPTLQIAIPLPERAETVSRALARVVAESDLSTFLREAVLEPALGSRIDERTLVPETTIEISRAELLAVIETLLDTDWARDQRSVITRTLTDYLTWRRDSIELELDLDPVRTLAAERLAQLLESKVRAWLRTRPSCTATGFARIVVGAASPLACEPRGRSALAYQVLLGAYVREQVIGQLTESVPSTWTLSLDVIRSSVSDDAWTLVERVRGWMRSGLTLDEGDVRALVDATDVGSPRLLGGVLGGPSLLDSIVSRVRQGFVVRVEDFVDPAEIQGPVELVRSVLDWLARMRAPVAVLIVLLITVIAFQRALLPRARLRIVALSILAGAVGALLVARIGEELASREARRAIAEPDDASLAVATALEVPRVAASMFRELGAAIELSSEGLLCLALVLLGGSWLVGGRRGDSRRDKPRIRGILSRRRRGTGTEMEAK